MKAWLKVIGLGLTKLPMKVAAWFVVPFLDDEARVNHPIFGVRDALEKGDTSWYWCAFRNGCHNMYTKPMPSYYSKGNTNDMTLEKLDGFQWRYRRSLDGEYVSFRMTWGAPDKRKGKDEFYVGWTMNDEDYMRLTFFQLRPAWILLIPIALLVLL